MLSEYFKRKFLTAKGKFWCDVHI